MLEDLIWPALFQAWLLNIDPQGLTSYDYPLLHECAASGFDSPPKAEHITRYACCHNPHPHSPIRDRR